MRSGFYESLDAKYYYYTYIYLINDVLLMSSQLSVAGAIVFCARVCLYLDLRARRT